MSGSWRSRVKLNSLPCSPSAKLHERFVAFKGEIEQPSQRLYVIYISSNSMRALFKMI
jgi:hypothetical protein